MSKIGIFSGSFDPVHAGHIAFALEAAQTASLDKVYFLPEALPRHKSGVTHFAHRLAMLKIALKPHKSLEVLELADKQFSVSKTLPKLQKKFAGDELHLLIGSDVLVSLAAGQWELSEHLLSSMSLVVGVRGRQKAHDTESLLQFVQAKGLIVQTDRPHVTSREIREALMVGQTHAELLGSLQSYIKKNWLYASLPVNIS